MRHSNATISTKALAKSSPRGHCRAATSCPESCLHIGKILAKVPLRPTGRRHRWRRIVGNEGGRSIEDSIAAVLQRKLGPYVAPRTPTERKLVELWRNVLGVDRVGITDSYEDLGVDSLLAASIFIEIEEKLAIAIPTAALVDAPTIEQLARKIDELAARRVK